MKRFFCWIRWHSWLVGYEKTIIDDPRYGRIWSLTQRCKWCGYEGMVDPWGYLW